MALDPQTLIDGYLDETQSPEEHRALVQWLEETPEHRQQFVDSLLLHDRLRGELLAMSTTALPFDANAIENTVPRRRRLNSAKTVLGFVVTLVVLMAVFWRGVGETSASAAAIELNRLIKASAHATDRTYQICVEDVAVPPNRDDRRNPFDFGRPPKPPIDGAILHVRRGNQFVLIRKTSTGEPFVTGSNGRTSWAVRPDGPARVSTDLNRFNRDLPGHESGIPLINIEEGLEQLRGSYDVQLLPIERDDPDVQSDESLRLLVAVKKKGFRGPRRVEITYAVATGQIREMRFVGMPYGPEKLTLRLTLLEEQDQDALFFDHESHHARERIVEEE